MESITLTHIEQLITQESYSVDPQVIMCRLEVGPAVIIGVSYCFNVAKQDVERGKASARKHAIDQLFQMEAYHQKRLRSNTDAPKPSLNPDNPFEGMVNRDVPLMVGEVNCQEALAEYAAEAKPISPHDEAKVIANLCKTTVLKGF